MHRFRLYKEIIDGVRSCKLHCLRKHFVIGVIIILGLRCSWFLVALNMFLLTFHNRTASVLPRIVVGFRSIFHLWAGSSFDKIAELLILRRRFRIELFHRATSLLLGFQTTVSKEGRLAVIRIPHAWGLVLLKTTSVSDLRQPLPLDWFQVIVSDGHVQRCQSLLRGILCWREQLVLVQVQTGALLLWLNGRLFDHWSGCVWLWRSCV